MPTGFSLLDMAEAFLEEAEVDYHSAKVDRVPPEDLKICALRVNVCTSRHLLAVCLLDHLKQELANPKTSSLIISPETTSSIRLELKSVANWSAEKYGISIPDWFGAEDDANVPFNWKDVTIKIYKDYKIGCFFGKEKRVQTHFNDIGLMGKAKKTPNNQGFILIGLSGGHKFPKNSKPEKKDTTAVSKIREALKSLTGISEDPFYPINDSDGWKPKFKLIDDRNNADVRAKQRAVHVSYQTVENYQAETKHYDLEDDIEAKSFDDEDDEAGAIFRAVDWGEGGEKLTIFQSDRKKGGESGEAGVTATSFLLAETPLSPVSPPFSGPVWGNGGGIFIVWNHFLIKAQFIGTDTVNSPFK